MRRRTVDEGPPACTPTPKVTESPTKITASPLWQPPCRIAAGAETLSIDPDLHTEGAPREPRRVAVSVFARGREEAAVNAEEVHRRHGDPDDRFAEQQHKRYRERHQHDRGERGCRSNTSWCGLQTCRGPGAQSNERTQRFAVTSSATSGTSPIDALLVSTPLADRTAAHDATQITRCRDSGRAVRAARPTGT